ncbi:MAG: hypothetical protein QXP56_07175 [Archaeoglobaceae archaeon]
MKRKLKTENLVDKKSTEKYLAIEGKWIKSNIKNQFQNPLKVSSSITLDLQTFYNIGLWMGDKYVYGGSVGLTNTSEELVSEFKNFLKSLVNEKRRIIEKRINEGKAKRVYVNSWILRRVLENFGKNINQLVRTEAELFAYLSGKIDADGTIMSQNIFNKSGLIKITYGNIKEAISDRKLFKKFGLRCVILPYKNRNAWDLKFSYLSSLKILKVLSLRHPEKKIKIEVLTRLTRR